MKRGWLTELKLLLQVENCDRRKTCESEFSLNIHTYVRVCVCVCVYALIILIENFR